LRGTTLAAGTFLLAGLGLARAAGAAPGPPLELAVQGCDQYDLTRLRELVSIEMGTIAARATRPPRAASAAAVRLACAGERATIEVGGGPSTEPSRLELDLAATAPATRLRLLALTITELVSLSWTAETPAAPAKPAAPPAAASEGVVGRPAPAPIARAFSLFVETSARRMAEPATWLGGIDVGLQRAAGSFAAAVVDLRAELGEASAPAARVDWRQLTFTAALAVGIRRERWAVHVLPGWSVGYAFLSGKPDAVGATGMAMTAMWTGPSLGLRARLGLGDAGFVALSAGSGFVTRRIVGLVDGATPIFEVRGAWALVGAAAGLDF
jgi:hypothetical protein